MSARSLARAIAGTGALTSAALTAHAAINMRLIRRPRDESVTIGERVSVLLPARNEAARITPTLRSLLAQEGLPDMEILILDDGSTDGTADVVRQVVGSDPRVKVIDGPDDLPPPGWLGKSWASPSRLTPDCGSSASDDLPGSALAALWWRTAPLSYLRC